MSFDLSEFLNGVADELYQQERVSVEIQDGPISDEEIDAIEATVKAMLAKRPGRVAFYRSLLRAGKKLTAMIPGG